MSKTATREAYGKALAGLISKRKDIIVLDADLSKSTKTSEAKAVCPNQHFNMGIAEANMMGVAAGLAASGKTVFASSFAMFAAGRAYEQIRNSIAYPKLNIKICATHAGLAVGEDGASHQCIEDLALMRVIPNMVVIQPCDDIQTREVIECIADYHGPCYVRLGRSAVEDVYETTSHFQIGKGNILKKETVSPSLPVAQWYKKPFMPHRIWTLPLSICLVSNQLMINLSLNLRKPMSISLPVKNITSSVV